MESQQKEKVNFVKYAKYLKAQGISVVPLARDGSKLPMLKWKPYQTQIMPDFEIEKYFANCGGVAAITGNSSNLYVLDFDLKYQLDTQDYWEAFMSKVPKELKKKMLINRTRNGGYHVWMRTEYQDRSRKLTRRLNTIPELAIRYQELVDRGIPPERASTNLLKNPFEVVIETRSKDSYAVFYHKDYQRFYGETLNNFSIEEIEVLNEIAYSLDYAFTPEVKFVGDPSDFAGVRKFNEDTSAQEVLSMLQSTGMFSYVDSESNGNIRVLRTGSKSNYSGRIYGETAVFHLFSDNTIFSDLNKSSFSPFEVFMVTKGLTYKQAVNELMKN